MLSRIINGTAIIASALKRIVNFCLRVISRRFTNPSKCFLYRLVPLNHRSNLFDPFTKKKEASISRGVVGMIGKTIPITPRPKKRNPKKIYKIFVTLFTKSPPFFHVQNPFTIIPLIFTRKLLSQNSKIKRND